MNKIYLQKEGNTSLVMVMHPVGSYYEPSKIKGISHFVEHMCFKGTKKRKRTEIDLAIERYGGIINAYTDTEMTCYWAKIANKYLDIAIDVISDLATNAVFPENEIVKERKVIMQELKMCEDDPSRRVYDIANKIYYPKYNGFHEPIIGTERSLYNINRKEILKFYKEYYQYPTLIIVGDMYNKIQQKYYKFVHPDYVINLPTKRKVLEIQEGITQSHILITSEVSQVMFTKNDRIILGDLLRAIYNDMNGRLFAKIREENNLVYGIHFDYQMISNGNIKWEVVLGLDKSKIDKAYKLIMQELSRPVNKKELEIAVTKTIGSHAMNMESLSFIANNIAYAERADCQWEDYLLNYEKNITRLMININAFLKDMQFEDNILVGIIPK